MYNFRYAVLSDMSKPFDAKLITDCLATTAADGKLTSVAERTEILSNLAESYDFGMMTNEVEDAYVFYQKDFVREEHAKQYLREVQQ